MINGMFSEIDKLKMGLDASWKRSEVISNNIANVDTPGYNRASVSFEEYYRDALEADANGFEMKRTRDKHFASMSTMRQPQIRVEVDDDTRMRMDENNVDIEKEMSDMATNTIYYYTLQSKVTSEFNQLRTAITGGGGV